MRRFGLALAVATMVALACVSAAQADTFGTGANQFDIDFVPISGDAGDLGSWPAGTGYTFTGANRDDYRMGVFEITNDQWNKFTAELGVTMTGFPATAYNQDPYWTGANQPTNEVSWHEAAQFVNWLNISEGHQAAYKFHGTQGTLDYMLGAWSTAEADNGTNLYRHKDAFYYLPTEDEWVKAGYWNGTTLQLYGTTDGAVPVAGSDSNFDNVVGQPWNVGSGSEELNGTFDMMGNVYEWMESPYSDPDYRPRSNRSLRGGGYSSLAVNEILPSSHRQPYDLDFDFKSVGFRVAAEVPEPSSLSLLLLGGLALLKRRRRAA